MGVVARRWILRHESRPYGAQQSRKLRNVGNHDGGTPSACTLCTLFSFLKSTRSKGRVRRVPAAAVIPAARVVLIIRSEEHTSELQSRGHLVCRLLLEK